LNWLDWLILAILAFSAAQGIRYGLVGSVAKLAGILVGFGVAITYYRDLAACLTVQWNLEEKILPLAKKLLGFWFPLKSTVPDKIVSTGSPAAGQIYPFSNYADYAAAALASTILNALCFMALLLAIVWAVNLAGFILTRIAAIAFLGPFNRLGGLLFGAVKGLIVVMIVLTLMSPFQQLDSLPGSSSATPGVTQSKGNAFMGSKLLPYFEPLFNTINRPLPGSSPGKTDQPITVKTI
jgi:membrane protein required for colicin V production